MFRSFRSSKEFYLNEIDRLIESEGLPLWEVPKIRDSILPELKQRQNIMATKKYKEVMGVSTSVALDATRYLQANMDRFVD